MEKVKQHITFFLSVLTSIIAIAVVVYKSGTLAEKVMASELRIVRVEACVESTNRMVLDKLDQVSCRLALVEGKLEMLIDKKSKK